MSSPTFKLKISNGTISAIYNDALAPLIEQGEAKITRASHVEPNPDGSWSAQMVNGPVLGPYRLRSEALTAEIQYLNAAMF